MRPNGARHRTPVLPVQRASPHKCAELAREPGCDAGGISDWAKRADAAGAAPDRNPFQMAEGLRRPRRENDRLGTENEILLKAGASFASRRL